MAFNRRETAILLIGDFLILVASLWTALFLRNLTIPSFSYFEINLIPFLPMFVLSLLIFYISGLYEKQTRPIRSVMGIRILGAQAATVMISAVLFFILPFSIAPKTILALYLLVSVAAESLWRFYRMNHELETGERTRALLIGTGPSVRELYEEINGNARYLIRFSAHLDTSDAESVLDAMFAGTHEKISVLVIDLTDPFVLRNLAQIYALMHNVHIQEFATLYEEIFDRVPVEHLSPAQLFESLPTRKTAYDSAKRLFDIALTLAVSVIAIPFVGIAAIGLLLTGGQPFIFSERIGKGGRIIRLLKLRTMLFFDEGDPEKQKQNRITAFGKVLRKARIDELPQLWNVLTGDISFIGPRPELPKIAHIYEQELPQYRLRHLIPPGLSGWAQIRDYDAPRGGADIERTRRKLSYDLYYLKHRSFGLDLAIAIKTLRTLAAFSGT
jgi:lipopolysaccharide/colanic/teichoic acid biosynthesis glycosyltransferase